MQKQFLKWLLIVVLTAFLVTFCTSYFIQTQQSERVGVGLIKLKIKDVKSQLDITNKNHETIKKTTYETAIIKARALAWIILKSPSIVYNQAELEKVKNILDVDELHVSNAKGILIASIPIRSKGIDMNSSKQTRAFMEAITNPKFEFVQEPMERGVNDGIFQYAAVARIDTPGIIQIGHIPDRLKNAEKLADIKNISDSFRIGKSGSILILEDDEIISGGINYSKFSENEKQEIIKKAKNVNEAFKLKLNNKNYIAISDTWDGYTIVGFLPENEMYLSRNSVVKVLIFVNLILFGVIFILISLLLKNIVISGIYKVNNSLEKITKGDLNERVDVHNVEEFKMLSDGINTTVDALKRAIEAEAKRFEEELELAKSIQLSALPNIFPPYPEHKEFEIHATMDTAKEVGGDFYDFFFIDPNHFVFLVADVSGKGIPAALFMMTTKTLLKNLAKTGLSPERLIIKVNEQICKTNEQGFFVTIFLCVLELSSGKLVCVNAGHNPPLIKRANGKIEYLKCRPNLVVGAINNVEYKSEEFKLNPNDSILLYTDGVTEAINNKKEFYGEQRLQNLLASLVKTAPVGGRTPKDVLLSIRNDVNNFANGVEQSDDITLLGIKYKGFKDLKDVGAASILLNASVGKFPNLIAWLENLCEQLNMPQASKVKLQIAVEEIFVNISTYAYPPKIGKVEIIFKKIKNNQVEMHFIDTGTPYNPLDVPNPDITLSAEERPIGGLGIFMVKKSVDFIDYKFKNGKNILTIKISY